MDRRATAIGAVTFVVAGYDGGQRRETHKPQVENNSERSRHCLRNSTTTCFWTGMERGRGRHGDQVHRHRRGAHELGNHRQLPQVPPGERQ